MSIFLLTLKVVIELSLFRKYIDNMCPIHHMYANICYLFYSKLRCCFSKTY